MANKKENKSNFRIIAEALASESLGNLNLPKEHLNKRKLTIDEIKELIREGFEAAKKSEKTKAKKVDDWGDAESENQMNWTKALKLKEFFDSETIDEADESDDEDGEDEEAVKEEKEFPFQKDDDDDGSEEAESDSEED